MLWEEVRKLYPDQWIQMKVLHSETRDNVEYVDEVAVVKPIPDEKEAVRLALNCTGDDLVFHTKHPEVKIEIRQYGLPRYYNVKHT